jgi:hypothetical protein
MRFIVMNIQQFSLSVVFVICLLLPSEALANEENNRAIADLAFQNSSHLLTIPAGDSASLWVSDGWILTKNRGTEFIHAQEAGETRQVFLDVSPMANGDWARMDGAWRLEKGFLVSGNAVDSSGSTFSTLRKYNDDGTLRMTVRLGLTTKEGVVVRGDTPTMTIIGATQLPDGDVALLWIGKGGRGGGDNILVGAIPRVEECPV